jgi:hypothetical protein
MALLATESRMGSLSTWVNGVDSYDSTKLGLSGLIKQYTGAGAEDKWAGPMKIGIARPIETAGAVPAQYPWGMQWSSTIDWIFFSDQAAVAATRRIQMYTFDRTTSLFNWVGSINCAFPYAGTQGTYTVNGFRGSYEKYSVGTASVSGTAVTGTSTLWQTNRMASGCRIGFGTTDPTQVTNWYEIASIGGEGSITLTASAGTVVDGPYVIEDLRFVMAMTNGVTATNGGTFLVKGIQKDTFTSGSTAIPAATTTDNIRAVYWLQDAGTVTQTASIGVGIASRVDWQTQYVYALSTLANPLVYKYNIRKNLTLTAGADTTAITVKSGAGGAVTGTNSSTNNVRIATLNHGNGSGIECIYFATTTRIYRTKAIADITAGDTTWLSDAMVELPPGGTATYAASATLKSCEVMQQIDRLLVPTAVRLYVTKYLTDGSQHERLIGANTLQLNQATASADLTPFPVAGAIFTVDNVAGITYMVSQGLTAVLNFIYAVPLSADWEYSSTSGHRLILPKFTTTGCTSFGRAYVNTVEILGGKTLTNLGSSTEGVRLLYRTSGISDNSGAWTVLDYANDLSAISAADEIQLAVEFRTMGNTCIPARVTSVGLTYNDSSTDNHYEPSVKWSNLTNTQFAWRFKTAFGSTVPRMKITLYDAVNGTFLTTDDSTTQGGTWEKSTDDGVNWGAYNTTDKGNETTYIRFTPASLGSGIKVRAVLQQY